MEKRSITDGTEVTDGVFCAKKMADAGLDAVTLSKILSERLGPFAPLLKNGFGFGAYVDNGKASVIGFTAPESEETTQ